MSNSENKMWKVLQFLKLSKANYKVFTVFFFISSFFWLLNALGKDYSIQVPVTIEYESMQENQTLVGFYEHDVSMEIEGTGYSLLKYYLFERYFSAKVDIHDFRKDSLATSEVVFVETMQALEQAFEGSYKIVAVKPTVVSTTVSKVASKKVPVIANVNIECSDGYGISSPYTLTPDSIQIKGAQIILDSISFVEAEGLILKDISSDEKQNLDIYEMTGVKMKENYVSFSVGVKAYIQHEIELPIRFVNISKKELKKITQKTVTLTYKTLDSTPLDLSEFIIDYKTANIRKQSIPCKIDLPKAYELISINPLNISLK